MTRPQRLQAIQHLLLWGGYSEDIIERLKQAQWDIVNEIYGEMKTEDEGENQGVSNKYRHY